MVEDERLWCALEVGEVEGIRRLQFQNESGWFGVPDIILCVFVMSEALIWLSCFWFSLSLLSFHN